MSAVVCHHLGTKALIPTDTVSAVDWRLLPRSCSQPNRTASPKIIPLGSVIAKDGLIQEYEFLVLFYQFKTTLKGHLRSKAHGIGWSFVATAFQLDFSLCPIFLPLPSYRCDSWEYSPTNFLHSNFCLRICLLGKPVFKVSFFFHWRQTSHIQLE